MSSSIQQSQAKNNFNEHNNNIIVEMLSFFLVSSRFEMLF